MTNIQGFNLSSGQPVTCFFPLAASPPRQLSCLAHQLCETTANSFTKPPSSTPSTALETAAMALISAKTIITSISLFHLTIAFFLLTNPKAIDDQALVYVLGESMGMVRRALPPNTALD